MGCGQSSQKTVAQPETVAVEQEAKPVAEAAPPSAPPAPLKAGDKVDVALDGGFQGEVLRCTTTDVLVKTAEGERWCEIEDIQAAPAATSPPLETEVQVGQKCCSSSGVSGTVVKRTTTEVCLKKADGELAWVGIEEVTYLKVLIHSSVDLRSPDDASKSDVCCDVQLEGKEGSKVTATATVTFDKVEKDWNFECRMVSYTPGDALTFIVYDKDAKVKGEGDLGKATLPAEHISQDGFFGDLQLEQPARGSVRVQVRVENAPSAPQEEPAVQENVVVEEAPSPPQKACCW